MDERPKRKPQIHRLGSAKLLLVYWRWVSIALGVALCFLWAWRSDWPGVVIADDINQHRANVALPAPNSQIQIRQTFVPGRDGLAEVELMLVKPAESTTASLITVQLRNENGDLVQSREYQSSSLGHNQIIRLTFPPESNSGGQQYNLIVAGDDGNDVSVWGYDLDVYSAGEVVSIGANSPAKDLRFITRYRLSLNVATQAAFVLLKSSGLTLLLGLSFMVLPGFLLLLSIGRRLPSMDLGTWFGMALALGLSTWSILWLWLTVVGARWRSWSLWVFFGLGWALAGMMLWQYYRQGRNRANRIHFHWQHFILLLILTGGLVVRLVAIRDLNFPPWVDSSHHALITQVMAESGQYMRDYSPYLPVERFPYHAGFHTISASLTLMATVYLPDLLLSLGQLINSFAPLAAYAATQLLSGRRNAGLLAALLVALPFLFPAYYTTWGRFTQVTGLVVLAVAIGQTWKLGRGAKSWRHGWWLITILASGLFLIHFRAFVLFAIFVAICLVVSRGRHVRYFLMSAIASLILVFPQIISLWRDIRGTRTGASIQGFNAFPKSYLKVGWEQAFLIALGVAVFGVILALFQKKRWAVAPFVLIAWVVTVALLLSGERLGLPETSLINLNSAYISLFLPMAIILGIVSDQILQFLRKLPLILRFITQSAAAAILVAMILFGIHQQVTILNPITFLARQEDSTGLAWLEQNVPGGALVASSSWLWQGNAWAASDGGAWILPLTKINSTIPPIGYVYGTSLAAEINAFNERASNVTDWSDPTTISWLQESHVDYIYVGPRGGFFDPSVLAKNPAMRIVYAQDGVFVFAIKASP